jgi:23S rRNA pseudouridine1911/1915/1917 synthase
VEKSQTLSATVSVGTEQRLDQFLACALPQLSRTRVKSLMQQGQVYHQEIPLFDPNLRVQEGETYSVVIPALVPCILTPKAMKLTIYYEDEHLLVLEKPAGLVVHPGAGFHEETLVQGLLAHCGDRLSGISGVQKPGLVHRLDKDTSGIMVVAKTDEAHRNLVEQFSQRTLKKIYWAFVHRYPSPPMGRVETLIGRHPGHRQKMMAFPLEPSSSLGLRTSSFRGRLAITTYRTLMASPKEEMPASLLVCQLHTGRTHQIRLHCAFLGHPVLGDALYGHGASRQDHGRQALHAKRLEFAHPCTQEWMAFESPLPEDLSKLYQELFKQEVPPSAKK